MRKQITLAEILEVQAFNLLASVSKIMPGVVTAYTASVAGTSPATVDVQPAVHDVRFDLDLGARVSEPWPVIPSVPLAWPKLAGCTIAGKMTAGDKVILLSFDLDPTGHLATGNASDPIDTRRHGGSYWLALPFDLTDPGAVTDPGNDLVFTGPGGGGFVVVGQGATDFAALASLVTTALNDLATWVKTGVAPPGGGAVTYATSFSPPPLASTLLKTK